MSLAYTKMTLYWKKLSYSHFYYNEMVLIVLNGIDKEAHKNILKKLVIVKNLAKAYYFAMSASVTITTFQLRRTQF